MTVCQELHDEIVYEGCACPLCAVIEAYAECQQTSEQQAERIVELLDQRDLLRSELRL